MKFNNIAVLAVIIACLFGSSLFAREKQKLTKEQLQKLEESWKPFSEETPRLKETPNVDKKEVDACVEKAINFLLSIQRPSGCWGAPTKTKKVNIYSPMPDSHISYIVGTTGLAVASLCEWENKAPKSVRDKITPAIEKGCRV